MRATRPNIVLIMADDMGYSDLGCYGSEIQTPNLDGLARHGLRWTQFYNSARCCPSRASLLTGLYPHQASIGQMVTGFATKEYGPAYRGFLNGSCVTIAAALGADGYRTLMSGKWHVGSNFADHPERLPRGRGFQRFWGIAGGAANYFRPNTVGKKNLPTLLLDDDTPVQAEGYFTDMISDHAVGYIEEYAESEQPFFLYVAYTAPHWPLHAPEEDIEKYRDVYQVGWDEIRARRYARQQEEGLIDNSWTITPRDKKAPGWENAPNHAWEAERMAVYAAQIDRMDQGVGRIVQKLQEKGALENTLIMFLSDNGGCAEPLPDNQPTIKPGSADTWSSYGLPWANASNTPFRLYKHWVHEGGISTPFIAHWPAQIKESSIVQQPAHLIDIMATCLDVAGVRYPRTHQGQEITPMEGHSLAPLFKAEKRAEYPICWEHEGNRAIRRGRWKLVSRFKAGSFNALNDVDGPEDDESWQLYDMEVDRTELHNLAQEDPERVAALAAQYEEWAQRVGVEPWRKVRRRQSPSKPGR